MSLLLSASLSVSEIKVKQKSRLWYTNTSTKIQWQLRWTEHKTVNSSKATLARQLTKQRAVKTSNANTPPKKQKQIGMWPMLKFCVYPTSKISVMSNNQGDNQWEKDKSLFCRFKLQCKRTYFPWPILKIYIHSEIIEQKRDTI